MHNLTTINAMNANTADPVTDALLHGGSVDSFGRTPVAGYMVSDPRFGVTYAEHVLQSIGPRFAARQYSDAVHMSARRLGLYFGGWQNDGVYYFDLSENVLSLDRATALGRERGERAIWDVANEREIVL